ncbi:MAG: c-type cytochrome [Planctomycetes bacterium]|nr:c-type cytochrome [Planctomycetota bacterium]
MFILSITAGFVYIGNAIPQIKTQPAEAITVVGETPEQTVAAGKAIFMSDRAQCLTCHSLGEDPKARCPNQEGLGERAGKRKPGTTAAQYLVESVYNPNAFIVPGYPRNQMKPVHKPPIALSHDEITAALMFLNTLGGKSDSEFLEQVKEAQDPWRKGLLRPEESVEADKLPILSGDAPRGHELYRSQGCVLCHRIRDEGRDVCPDLSAIGGSQSPDYILESILTPSAIIVKGYKEVKMSLKPRRFVRGVPVKWVPDREHPKSIVLSVDAGGGQREEQEVDLSEATSIGETAVVVKKGKKVEATYGDYVSGDQQTGVTMKMLENGEWIERRFHASDIKRVDQAESPMPSNFAEMMTPSEIYDLVSFLMAQKGKK